MPQGESILMPRVYSIQILRIGQAGWSGIPGSRGRSGLPGNRGEEGRDGPPGFRGLPGK